MCKTGNRFLRVLQVSMITVLVCFVTRILVVSVFFLSLTCLLITLSGRMTTYIETSLVFKSSGC